MKLHAILAAAVLSAGATAAFAENPMVGGAAMFADKTIVENAVNSPINTTLVAAVQAAGLVDTLNGPGPFTVLAPTDEAFAMIDPAALQQLLLPEHKAQLQQILTCHVIAAKAMSSAIAGMVADDGGVHEVTTVGGCVLKLRAEMGTITVEDERGRKAKVIIADVEQSNGVIHVIDKVLLPAG